jgi:hypothetical protein
MRDLIKNERVVFSNCIVYIMSDGKIIVNGKLGRMWKEAVIKLFLTL